MNTFNSTATSTDETSKVSETYYSARAFLAGLGSKLKALDIFAPIAQGVTIAQKTVKDTPIEKLYDTFISMLCGAKGIVEVNKLVRSDPGEATGLWSKPLCGTISNPGNVECQ